MPATALEIRNLRAGYGPTRIIEDISFNVGAGDRLAVLGRNGMGKTTLLATLMGLTTRHGGEIRLGDQDIAVLMIEHDMDLVFKFAKRVLVLAAGRLIFEGSPADVTADHEVRRAYLGSYADARHSP